MVNQNINDEKKWSTFVKKLISDTQEGKFEWEDFRRKTSRERSIGSIFVAEIVENKFVAAYRYIYHYYTDVDEYEEREDIAIEIVDSVGSKLWRLPDVNLGYQLLDLIEFMNADADGIFDAFLSDDA